jgi:hypothetical protein
VTAEPVLACSLLNDVVDGHEFGEWGQRRREGPRTRCRRAGQVPTNVEVDAVEAAPVTERATERVVHRLHRSTAFI